MMMIDQQVQRQIYDLVNACSGYWELRGIPLEQRTEMREELEQHLEQAVRDGKTLEVVVGSNALAFAERWAREVPHRVSGGLPRFLRWLVFDWLTYALLFLAFIAIFGHIVLRSPIFSLPVVAVVCFGFIGLFLMLHALVSFLASRIASRENRTMLAFGIYAAISIAFLIVLRLIWKNGDMIVLHWGWPVTLLIAGIALALFGCRVWLARVQRLRESVA